jgi:hypothetical protein
MKFLPFQLRFRPSMVAHVNKHTHSFAYQKLT